MLEKFDYVSYSTKMHSTKFLFDEVLIRQSVAVDEVSFDEVSRTIKKGPDFLSEIIGYSG